jgi:hypothetical protein
MVPLIAPGLPPKHIVVDMYEGAYGPTIRIDTQSVDDLLYVLALVKCLAQGQVERQAIVDCDRFVLTGLAGINMRVAKDGTKSTFRLSSDKGRPLFEWVQDREGWQNSLAFMGPLLSHKEPSHQYLTTEDDDALVELAYME